MTNAIEVENIEKTYRGAPEPIRALAGVSFDVRPGQIYGLLGPNGAGKTTLVKILTTIIEPGAGTARIHGFDVRKQPLEVRRQIAAVLQQTAVETLLTVEDNLRIYARLHGLKTPEISRRVKLVLEEFELGSNARQIAQDLSLGTKRRLQVAKIFMADSPVIFLDECTTGMDPLMRRRVLDRIRLESRNGRTVLLTTHVLSEAEELCDQIMILHRGKSLASGSLQELQVLSQRMFRVNLTFARADESLRGRLELLKPEQLRIEEEAVEMLFRGEEASLLDRLTEIARAVPLRHFEVRGASLEDIFVDLVKQP